jgi:hypothetical protein
MENYVLFNRVGITNGFGVGDSTNSMMYSPVIQEDVHQLLRIAKRKNPQYKFSPKYYEEVRNDEIDDIGVYDELHAEKVNEFSYPELSTPKNTWEVNGQEVNVNYFVQKYDEWNQNWRFTDPSKESVLRFFEDVFPDFIRDEKLRQEVLWVLTDREVLNENAGMNKLNNVAYSAVVLDEASKQKLIKVFKPMISEGWEIIAHHMTLNMGTIDPKYVDDLNKDVELSVTDYAIDDKVMAVGVKGYPTNNKKAHITLAVNRQGGGKPVMSNNLTDWRQIQFSIPLMGKITEVSR